MNYARLGRIVVERMGYGVVPGKPHYRLWIRNYSPVQDA